MRVKPSLNGPSKSRRFWADVVKFVAAKAPKNRKDRQAPRLCLQIIPSKALRNVEFQQVSTNPVTCKVASFRPHRSFGLVCFGAIHPGSHCDSICLHRRYQGRSLMPEPSQCMDCVDSSDWLHLVLEIGEDIARCRPSAQIVLNCVQLHSRVSTLTESVALWKGRAGQQHPESPDLRSRRRRAQPHDAAARHTLLRRTRCYAEIQKPSRNPHVFASRKE